MTLGNAAANHIRIIVWRKACQHQVEPDPAEMASRHGARPCSTVARAARQCRRFDPVVSRSRMRSLVWLQRAPGSAAVST
jgi:hypothetical protein